MRLRLFALGGAILTAVTALYVLHVQWLGFPDGALTELDRAERGAFTYVAAIASAMVLAAFALGARRSAHPRAFHVLLGLTIALVVGVVALDVGFRVVLDHGAGG